VKNQKTVLVVADGASMQKAEKIAKALRNHKVSLVRAEDFSPEALLGAELYFFGCEAPGALARLKTALLHINLAGRSCGLFGRASTYLRKMAHNSELVCTELQGGDLRAWAKGI
jgi:hypothetical protein